MTKCYGHEECEYNGQPECRLPDGMDCPHGLKVHKPTNADRIRAMDDEQMAKLFYSVYKRSCIDFVNQSGIKAEIKFKNNEASEAAFLKYLQSPAEEDIPHEYKNCLYHTVSFNGCTPDHNCTNPDGGCSNNYDRWKWRGPHKED